MQYTIENELASVTVDEHASEIHSFKEKGSNTEYMWQGDPAYWKGRNPTLFPMVGSTWDKKLHINGKEYVTGNHGFTRNSDFTCIVHTSNKIVMELKDNEETLKQYPFHFTMHITYELKEDTLSIDYAIMNQNAEVMPFNFGLHPAFNCPLRGGEYADYCIKLNAPEVFDASGVHYEDEDRITLDPAALKETIIITAPKSTEASLTNGKHGVTVHYEGYEWLAFWSPEAPFVCIEPWHSHTDFIKVEVPFEEREGTLFLEPNKEFTTSYSIKIW